MLSAVAWAPDTGFMADVPPGTLQALAARPEVIVWVDAEGLAPGELEVLRTAFDLHPAAVDECRDFASLPKIDDFGGSIVVVLHRVQFEESTRDLQLKEINFLLGRNWLLTVREDSSTSVDSVRRKVAGLPEMLRDGPGRIMAEIMDVITGRYVPTVEFLEKEIERVEEQMFDGRVGTEAFSRILSLRHTVVALRRSLVPQREVIHRLAREEFRIVGGAVALRLRSTHDELAWILTELEIHRELLTSAFEGHAAIASNRLAEVSNRMNQVMERLTRFATVFMPLTLVTGIYGMNFDWMPELRMKWGYPVVVAGLLLGGLALARYFRRTLPPGFDTAQPPTVRGGTRIVRKARAGSAPKATGIGPARRS